VDELAGGGEAPEPPETCNEYQSSKIIFNILSYVCQHYYV